MANAPRLRWWNPLRDIERSLDEIAESEAEDVKRDRIIAKMVLRIAEAQADGFEMVDERLDAIEARLDELEAPSQKIAVTAIITAVRMRST